MKRKIGLFITFISVYFFVFSQTDTNFTWIVEPKFDIVEDFVEDLSRVKIDGKWGFINSKGQMVVAFLYDSVSNYTDGLAAFLWKNGKWGFVDKSGKNVIYPQFDYVGSFSGGSASALKGNTWGMIDKKGNFIGEPEIDNSGEMLASLAVAQIQESPQKMNAALAEKFSLDYVGKYNYSLAAVSKDGDWGFIDQDGNIVIDLLYEAVGDFSNNVARFSQYGKWGYLNTSGNIIIPEQFDDAKDFNNEIAFVLIDKKWGLIRKNVETDILLKNKEGKRREKN